MITHPQATISAAWAALAWASCALAGESSITLFAALIVVAGVQTLGATAVRQMLAALRCQPFASTNAVAAVISWTLLSALIALAAVVSRTLAAMMAIGLVVVWAVATKAAAPRSAAVANLAEQRQKPFDEEHTATKCVVLLSSLVALYLAWPALVAAKMGYHAYDAAVWIDAPFHASYIASLSKALATGTYVDIHGTAMPTQFYHHASYGVAAMIASSTEVPCLVLTQAYTVWGAVWLGLAIYAVARQLTVHMPIAVAASVMTLAAPDPGMMSWGHPLYGFHWILQVASASGMALAIALCAWALLVHSCRHKNICGVLLGWSLCLSLVLFKAQLFVAVSVPMFLYPAVVWPDTPIKHRAMIVGLQCAVVAVVTRIASNYASIPLILLDFSVAVEWLTALQQSASPTLEQLLKQAATVTYVPASISMAAFYATWQFMVWATLLLIVAVLSLSAPAAFAPITEASRGSVCEQPNTSHSVVWAFVAAHIATMIGLSADNRMATGGPLEVHLQTQMWSYALGTVSIFALLLGKLTVGKDMRQRLCIAVIISFAALVFCLERASPIQRITSLKAPSFVTAPSRLDISKLTGASASADVVFIGDGDPLFVWQGAIERATWVADYALNPRHRPIVQERLAQWRAVHKVSEQWFRERHIDWYVVPRAANHRASKKLDRPPDLVGESFDAWRIRKTSP